MRALDGDTRPPAHRVAVAYVLGDRELHGIPRSNANPKLNMNYALYEVIPGFYRVRGFDLANITFVKGKTGWIGPRPRGRHRP